MVHDLTVGKPSSILISYSMPMLLSAAFQQLYNMADSIIAGQFAGEDALAAIGASFPVTMIFMAAALGMSVGCSVVMARFFGGKHIYELKTAINTAYISMLVLCAALTAAGLIWSQDMLFAMNTPDNIIGDAKLYLDIYMGGMIFLFLYNICTAIFTALGDSKTPLYFLIASSLGNIALDLLFVAVFDMGVAGVAWATFIAQGVASLAAFAVVSRRMKCLGGTRGKVFSGHIFGNMAKIAVPSILQQSFVSIGNLMVQGIVNGYGSTAVAGYSAAIRINTFALTLINTEGGGISNYTAQNIGAGKWERIWKGYRFQLIFTAAVAVGFSIISCVFGRTLIGFFGAESEAAVGTGMDFLKIVAPLYCVVTVKIITDGVLRGMEKVIFVMTDTFVDLIIRVICAFALCAVIQNVTGIAWAWAIGWAVSVLLSICFLIRAKRRQERTALNEA